MVTIRFCGIHELPKLQKFIDEKWRKNHRLSHDVKLLNFQHLNLIDNILNYVVAVDDDSTEIIAILGFIPISQYDAGLRNEKDLWLAIWKTDEQNPKSKGTGVQMLEYLIEKFKPNSIGAIGINARVKKLYQALQYKTGVLSQYYYLNPKITNFKIAVPKQISQTNSTNSSALEIIHHADIGHLTLPQTDNSPLKSIDYCINRYAKHVSYPYLFYGIYKNKELQTLWVIRKITIENSSCLRIVDMLGNLQIETNISSELNKILAAHNAEYIDILTAGLPEEVFIKQGFSKRTNEEIIPNYFEPFEQRNVDIEFAYKTTREHYIIFKGDSDQDRPN
jgi:hypothetical protein